MYTAQHAVTTLSRKATFRNNRSDGVGGAVHSAGVTMLQGDAVFRENSSLVSLPWFSGAGGRRRDCALNRSSRFVHRNNKGKDHE